MAHNAPANSDRDTIRPVGFHSWRHLTFLHWRVAADELQRHLPGNLEVETFDGSAWLGLVPFSMECVRPRWAPPVPGISWFLETNVRTYVRHESGMSGVWFFSLDASSRIAVAVARRFWGLPYFHARMSLNRSAGRDGLICYSGTRTSGTQAGSLVEVELPQKQALRTASEQSLEHFLIERYVLFTPTGATGMSSGRVHHHPYQFQEVRVHRCEDSLVREINPELNISRPPDHAVYSPGVDVAVTKLESLAP